MTKDIKDWLCKKAREYGNLIGEDADIMAYIQGGEEMYQYLERHFDMIPKAE